MKKLLFILNDLQYGGTEQVLIDILQHLDESFDLSLCLIERRNELNGLIPSRVRIIHYNHFPFYKSIRRICNYYNVISIWFFLERISFCLIMARRKFDSVISFKEGESVLFHSFIFHRRNQKNITWIHTNLSLNHWTMFWVYNNKPALERNIYRNKHLSNLIFVSQSQKACFQTLYPDACPTQSVIYNLINKDQIIQKSQQFEVSKRQFTICCIGRLSIEKRIDKAILAANQLKQQGFDFELWIVGDGFCYQDLTAMIDQLDLTDCVKMLGYQPNPFPYLKAADVLLLTSDTESFSLVLCEALCLAKPVVSTPTFGPVELLERKYGLISAFDVSSIANCLAELMIDKDLYANLSELSLQRVDQLFDIQKTMQQIYELL